MVCQISIKLVKPTVAMLRHWKISWDCSNERRNELLILIGDAVDDQRLEPMLFGRQRLDLLDDHIEVERSVLGAEINTAASLEPVGVVVAARAVLATDVIDVREGQAEPGLADTGRAEQDHLRLGWLG